jgi:hypothetical protein
VRRAAEAHALCVIMFGGRSPRAVTIAADAGRACRTASAEADSKRACENKSENIRADLKGFQRSPPDSTCERQLREVPGQRSIPVTVGHSRIATRTYYLSTGGQEVVGSNPASPTKDLVRGYVSRMCTYRLSE